MRTIHVSSVSDTRELYLAYFAENPFWRFTSYISAADAVGNLLMFQKDALITVIDLDKKVKI